jgi:hypothetical protein
MIPADLAARLRTLAEASFFDSEPPVQGTAKVREIQARLPQFLPGQQFTATLQRPLPDGTFQAIVAGHSYTLALAHTAKAGDTLELVVTRSTPNAIFAQLADPAAQQRAAADPGRPELSPTGRLISFLLTGQPPPRPLALAGGRALLDTPPAGSGAPLAPLLRQALSQSGLFYEFHQLQWLSGKFDLARLLREPQGQHGPPARAGAGTAEAAPQGSSAGTGSPAGSGAPAATGTLAAATAQARTGQLAPPADTRAGEPPAEVPSARSPAMPERLMPIVHQQLDAMATQHYVVHAQAWPGQNLEWEIDDSDHQRGGGDADDGEDWHTTLRMTMPRLGGVEAELHLSAAGVALRLRVDNDETLLALEAARPQLEAALAGAGIALTGFAAERTDEQA